MPSAPLIFATIYGPALLAIVFLIGLAKAWRSRNEDVIIFKPFTDFLDFKVPIRNVALVRALFVCGFLGSLSSYVFIDYAILFPSRLQMEVFFDEQGLSESLKAFTPDEISRFHVPSDSDSYRERYFRQLDGDAAKLLHIKVLFGLQKNVIHSVGQTTFVVEKTNGIQNYHIADSRGELKTTVEAPNIPQTQFVTLFEKLDSKDDYLTPNFRDLFINGTYILKPVFKEMLAQDRSSQGVLFRFTVVGATKLYLLPWPKYSNTVYFADFGPDGLVPIAYAIYR